MREEKSIILSYSVCGNCDAAVENQYRFWHQELGVSFMFLPITNHHKLNGLRQHIFKKSDCSVGEKSGWVLCSKGCKAGFSSGGFDDQFPPKLIHVAGWIQFLEVIGLFYCWLLVRGSFQSLDLLGVTRRPPCSPTISVIENPSHVKSFSCFLALWLLCFPARENCLVLNQFVWWGRLPRDVLPSVIQRDQRSDVLLYSQASLTLEGFLKGHEVSLFRILLASWHLGTKVVRILS